MKILAAIILAVFAQDYPDHVGVVNDFVKEIDQNTKTKIEAVIADVKTKANVNLVVVTVPSLQGLTVEDYTVGLAKKWGVGQKGLNNGILFLHAPKERKIRIENGYGVESRLTDIESKMIIQNTIIPLMKANRFAEAILEGAKEIGRVVAAPEKEPEKDSVGQVAVPLSAKSDSGDHSLFVIVVLVTVFLVIVLLIVLSSSGGYRAMTSQSRSIPPRPKPSNPLSEIDPLSAMTIGGLLAANKLPSPEPPPVPPPSPAAPFVPDPGLSIELFQDQRRRREEEEERRRKRRREEEEEEDNRRRSSSSSSSSYDSGSSSSDSGSSSFGGGDFGGGGASGDY